MPDMDFSVVLNSRELKTTISVTAATVSIDASGVAQPLSSTTTKTKAVVVPGKSDLRRLGDGTRIEAYIDVYTRYRISQGGPIDAVTQRVADVITWQGRQYVVAAVEDYSAFGPGFFHASCDLIQLNPAA